MAAGALLVSAVAAHGQNVTYDADKQVVPPDYATLRIGNFYSTIAFHGSVGFRYSTSTGEGQEYIVDGERGRITEDGPDFPMIAVLDFRNYIPLSSHSEADISVRVGYRYYPLGTQESEWILTIPDERLAGNFSTTYRITPALNGIVYDRIEYITDYVDDRGLTDDVAGRPYERIQNKLGTTLTWTLTEVSHLDFDLSRRDVIVTDNEEEFGNQERVEYYEGVAYHRKFFDTIDAGGRFGLTQTDYADEERPDTTLQDYEIFIGGSEGGGIPLTDNTTLTLSLGTSVGTSDRTDTQDANERTAITGGAGLRTQLTKDLAHELTYEHGLRSGFDTDFEEYDQWGYRIDYTKAGTHVRVYTRYETIDASGVAAVPYDEFVAGIGLNYPLLTYLTLDCNYEYRMIFNHPEDVDGPDLDGNGIADAAEQTLEERDDYYTRTIRIGSTLGLFREFTLRAYVERYERLSDLNELEFSRDTFEIMLIYSHQF